MRVVLFTGKGGVGKTTLAAATGVLAARSGRKTLLVSAGRPLSAALGVRVGPEPSEVDTGLCAVRVSSQDRFERTWSRVRGYLLAALAHRGEPDLSAEELTVLPGADEVLALLELRDLAASGRFDAVLVDCASTTETLRLLALPEALTWYLERLFPTHHRVMRSVRPLLGRLPAAVQSRATLLDAVGRLHAELAEVRELLRAPGTSVRLVLTPEAMVVAEARHSLTSLALYGYRVDSLVANRVFPAGGGEWVRGWARAQRGQLDQLDRIRQAVPGLTLRTAPYCPAEPVGLPALQELARQVYSGEDPLGQPAAAAPPRVERDTGEFVLVVDLPLVERDEVRLSRSGDELVLTVAGRRRLLTLPSVLRRCTVTGAEVARGALRVRFRPDLEMWPAQLAGNAAFPAR